MENINGKSRASFRWMLSCAPMGLAASVSLCFAQENRSVSQEMQRQEMEQILRQVTSGQAVPSLSALR